MTDADTRTPEQIIALAVETWTGVPPLVKRMQAACVAGDFELAERLRDEAVARTEASLDGLVEAHRAEAMRHHGPR